MITRKQAACFARRNVHARLGSRRWTVPDTLQEDERGYFEADAEVGDEHGRRGGARAESQGEHPWEDTPHVSILPAEVRDGPQRGQAQGIGRIGLFSWALLLASVAVLASLSVAWLLKIGNLSAAAIGDARLGDFLVDDGIR